MLPLDRLDRLELPADQLRVIGPAEADIRALGVAPLARPGASHELELLALAIQRVYHPSVGPEAQRPVLSLATPPAAALPPVDELVALGQVYVCHYDLADAVVLWVVEYLDGPVPLPSVPLAVRQVAPLGRPARARLARSRFRRPAIVPAEVLVDIPPQPPLCTVRARHLGDRGGAPPRARCRPPGASAA